MGAYGDSRIRIGVSVFFQDDLEGCSGRATCGQAIETWYACLTWFHLYSEEGMGEYLVHLIAWCAS